MLPVAELIQRGFGNKGLPNGCAMFGGTFAAKGGIRPATRFEIELVDPVLNRSIRHAPADGTGVIIRETPPPGRELSVTVLELPVLG